MELIHQYLEVVYLIHQQVAVKEQQYLEQVELEAQAVAAEVIILELALLAEQVTQEDIVL